MKTQCGVFMAILGFSMTSANIVIAAPQTVVIAPTANTTLNATVNSSGVSSILPPAGGQLSAGGVGGQFSSMRPGGQFMPGTSPGGQLAPGQIPGGTASGTIPALPAINPFSAPNFGQTFNQSGRVIVTGNSSIAAAPGGMISGSGVGGNSRVIVTGANTTVAPGGAISGNGVGGSRVIVTGASATNTFAAPSQSSVIVTGNTLTGSGVGGTNLVPALR
ncbi:MAG TPA: hypothetical protein VGO67_22555 [Verrucomicrobiae bacterium]|jgi:hypothetical protein